jgi:hypothetical protein
VNKKKEENQKRDIFKDPTLAESLKLDEDPIVAFLGKHWKQMTFMIVLVIGIFYARNLFEETNLRSMHSASNLYAQVRIEFGELSRLERELQLVTLQEAEGDKDKLEQEIEMYRERLQLSLNALSDAKEPYSSLSNIYSDILSRNIYDIDVADGDMGEARAGFSNQALRASDWQGERKGSSKRFFAELSGLVNARSLLDMESSYHEGRQALQALARDGQFVNVTAAIALARVSASAEEKEEARDVIALILSRHPEQTNLLEPEMRRLMS